MAREIERLLFTNEKRDLVGVGEEIPVQYTIPYTWGTLRVSQQAHDFYGFVPLTATTLQGQHDQLAVPDAAPERRVDIFLLAPNEMPNNAESRGTEPGGVSMIAERHKTGLALGIAFDTNAARMQQLIEAELQGHEAAEVLSQYTPREIRQKLTQAHIHGLSDLLGEEVSDLLSAAMKVEGRQQAVRRFAGRSALRAGLVGVITGAYEALGPNHLTLGFLGAMAMAYLGLSYSDFKSYVTTQPFADIKADAVAMPIARQVASDIHTTFCSAHFDRQWGLQDPELEA